jgi:hypothetical protein
MPSDWQKLRALSSRERWLLLQAIVLLPVIMLAQRCFGLRPIRAALRRFVRAESTVKRDEKPTLSRDTITRLVQVAANRGIGRPTCLHQSLVLWMLLRRYGFNAELWFGVRREMGTLEAHAWIEHQGNVLNDIDDVGARFASFPVAILPDSCKF